jgi:hypothetical protein
MPISKSDLFNVSGRPIRGVTGVLSEYNCESIEQLEDMVASGELTFEKFFRRPYKGCGSKSSPGRLARFLFKIDKKQDKSKFLGLYWAWLSPTGKLLPSTIRRKAGDSDSAFSDTDQKYRLRRIGQECTQVKVRITQILH